MKSEDYLASLDAGSLGPSLRVRLPLACRLRVLLNRRGPRRCRSAVLTADTGLPDPPARCRPPPRRRLA
jgi:hypothetical protein